MDAVIDAFWVGGINSMLDPMFLKPTQFQWSTNVDISGGYAQTRQGFSRIPGMETHYATVAEARGMTVFAPSNRDPAIIIAKGDKLLYSSYPFTGNFTQLPGASWRDTHGPVTFVHAVQSVKRATNGLLEVIPSKAILIIQDGQGRAMIWDGVTLMESNPSKTDGNYGIPIGLWGAWSGNRYWVSNGTKLRASNLADPTTFTEEDDIASGGFFTLPDDITGLGQTPDYKNLLVFTGRTTTSIQSSVLDRTMWAQTNDFQRVILPAIGCAAGKSITNQFGLTWWYSHGGLIGLDQALQTYRSSRIIFRDQEMMRSKANLDSDLSGIACGTFGNYLLVSVPSGDKLNAHTWVLNQSVLSQEESPAEWGSVWTGVRPVEWVTAIVHGQERCMFLSADYGDQTADSYVNPWEAFVEDRADYNPQAAKSITAMFETRMLAASESFKTIEHAEIELAELSGVVDIEVYYSGSRGAYKKILEQQIVASPGSPNAPTTTPFEYDPDGDSTILTNWRPQRRVLRTQSIAPFTDGCTSCGVESNKGENHDRGFSLLIKWTGRMAIAGIRLFYTIDKEHQIPPCASDESDVRYVTELGCGTVATGVAQPETFKLGPKRSKILPPITPRYNDFHYTSFIKP